MSLSTDAVLIISMGEAPPELTTNTPEFLLRKGVQQGFGRLSLDEARGNNCMGGEIWAAGFDYVSQYALTTWLGTIPWQFPQYVICIITDESDDGVTVWSPKHGVLVRSEFIR